MDKKFIILEIQDGPFVFFANAWVGDPATVYTEDEAAREIDSFIRQKPASRFLIVDIAPNLGFGGAF